MLIYKDIPEPPTFRPLFFVNERGAAQEHAGRKALRLNLVPWPRPEEQQG